MEANVPVSSVDCYYDAEKPQLLLLLGDELGHVRVSDITCCVTDYNLVEVDEVRDNKDKRNPYFRFSANQFGLVDEEGDKDKEVSSPCINEDRIKDLFSFKAHGDVIRAV